MRYQSISTCKLIFHLYLLPVICVVAVTGQTNVRERNNLGGKFGEGYYIEVWIGYPPQKFNVLVDTGSTNFAIAAAADVNVDTYYNSSESKSYQPHHRKVSVFYTQGYWVGELGSDYVRFPSLSVPRVWCDVATIETSHNFYMNGSQWQGILGLAYPVIARPDRSVVSWLGAAKKELGEAMAFSLELCGADLEQTAHTGTMRVLSDTTDEVPGLLNVPLVREWFYELLLVEIQVGGIPVKANCQTLNTDKTILDSGTTNLRLPGPVFQEVASLLSTSSRLPEAAPLWDQPQKFCHLGPLDWSMLPVLSLRLAVSKHSYLVMDLPPQSYIRGVESPGGLTCYKLVIEPSTSGTVLGVVAMEGLVVVFNQSAKTVGFAPSNCGPRVNISGPFNTTVDTSVCVNPTPSPGVSALSIGAYIVVALLCGCAAAFIYDQCLCRQYFRRRWSQFSSQAYITYEE